MLFHKAKVIKDIEQRVQDQYDLVNNLVIEEIDSNTFSISGEGLIIPNGDGMDRWGFNLSWGKFGLGFNF